MRRSTHTHANTHANTHNPSQVKHPHSEHTHAAATFLLNCTHEQAALVLEGENDVWERRRRKKRRRSRRSATRRGKRKDGMGSNGEEKQ